MTTRRLRPLTIAQLKLAAEAGTLTPEDILACSWIRKARTPRLPHSAAGRVTAEVASYVRAWREDRNITAREFGESIGVAGSFISQIETGIRHTVTLDTLLRLAEGCGAELRCTFISKPRRARNVKAA